MVRRTLQLLAVVGLCLVFTGCYAGKYTGGGWIPSSADHDGKATFGVTINVPEDAEPNDDANLEFATGQIQYNDHDAGVALHGEVAEGGVGDGTWGVSSLTDEIYFTSPYAYLTGTYWPVPKGQGEPGIFHAWVGEHANTTGFEDPFEEDFLYIRLEGGTHDGYGNFGLVGGGTTKYHPPKD